MIQDMEREKMDWLDKLDVWENRFFAVAGGVGTGIIAFTLLHPDLPQAARAVVIEALTFPSLLTSAIGVKATDNTERRLRREGKIE